MASTTVSGWRSHWRYRMDGEDWLGNTPFVDPMLGQDLQVFKGRSLNPGEKGEWT